MLDANGDGWIDGWLAFCIILFEKYHKISYNIVKYHSKSYNIILNHSEMR